MRSFVTLARSGDFLRIRRSGRRVSLEPATVFIVEPRSSDLHSIVGITVSSKIGGAVVRNRLRRRIAAALHEAFLCAPGRVRLVALARREALAMPFGQLVTAFKTGLAQVV